MAFKMKGRPIIQGTSIHKASVAKAKIDSIVAQTRTTADASLTTAGGEYGKSLIGKEIDYTIEQPEIKIPDSDKKKKKENLDERLRKAEELADWEKNEDIEGLGPGTKPKAKGAKKESKYTSPEADESYARELKEKEIKGLSGKKMKRAKELGVKVSELEAKEINGKKDYFPKEGVMGGTHRLTDKELIDSGHVDEKGKPLPDKGTQWSDAKGRFLIPTGGYSDEEIAKMSEKERKDYEIEMDNRAKKEVADNKFASPSQGDIKTDDLSDIQSMVKTGDIVLNTATNTYEYTNQYLNRQNTPSISTTDEGAPTDVSLEKPNIKDFKMTTDYMKARMKYFKSLKSQQDDSGLKMRDDRIWRNAVEGGTVHKNMRKSGYTPHNER